MELLNILSKITVFGTISSTVELDFIGNYIGWLIGITGSVGLGVILFTLTLKLIVLPFDIFSKVKSKQNAIKMERMRPELEKMQKKYANDKNTYNQKMFELQKKNGYSAFSGCLPMILSLIVFIIAINSFRAYSAVAMIDEYNDIVEHYNASVVELTVEGDKSGFFKKADSGEISLNNIALYNAVETELSDYSGVKQVIELNGETFALKLENDKFNEQGSAFIDKIYEALGINNGFLAKNTDTGIYSFDYRDAQTEDEKQSYRQTAVNAIVEVVGNAYISEKISPQVNEMVKTAYESGEISKSSFLWVKNIWLPDVSYEHPIASHSTFQTTVSQAATKSCSCETKVIEIDETTYNTVTAGLYEQKEQANGYFILIVLSVGINFLSQFLMQKMQKAQLELQSADGQAAMTQKMMMWMMPIMFGFFAFQYSSSFSIYMIVSSAVSTLSSLIINWFVEKKYNNIDAETVRSKKNINKIEKERLEAEEQAKKKAEEKANRKNKKENNSPANERDFLSKK